MQDEKRTTVGVSLLPSLLHRIDAHIKKTSDGDRSAYFRRLALADIEAAAQIDEVIRWAGRAEKVAGRERTVEALRSIEAQALRERAANIL